VTVATSFCSDASATGQSVGNGSRASAAATALAAPQPQVDPVEVPLDPV